MAGVLSTLVLLLLDGSTLQSRHFAGASRSQQWLAVVQSRGAVGRSRQLGECLDKCLLFLHLLVGQWLLHLDSVDEHALAVGGPSLWTQQMFRQQPSTNSPPQLTYRWFQDFASCFA